MIGKPDNTYVSVEIDQKALGVVQRSFDYVVENHQVVDWAMPTIPHLEDLQAITDKLKRFSDSEDEAIKIPMTRAEWIDYSCLVDYIGTVLPADWKEERILLEDLSFQYSDIDDKLENNSL